MSEGGRSEWQPSALVKNISYFVKDVGLVTTVVFFVLGIWTGLINSPMLNILSGNQRIMIQNQSLLLTSNAMSYAQCMNNASGNTVDERRCKEAHDVALSSFVKRQPVPKR